MVLQSNLYPAKPFAPELDAARSPMRAVNSSPDTPLAAAPPPAGSALHPPAGPEALGGVLTLAASGRLVSEELTVCLAAHRLGEAHLALLWACHEHPSAMSSQTQLALRAHLSPAHVSGQLEQLRSAGYVAGQRDALDRRRQCWKLTPAGRQMIERLAIELEPQATRWLQLLSAASPTVECCPTTPARAPEAFEPPVRDAQPQHAARAVA